MNNVIHKKMKLFILAIIVLIMLCLVFINYYSKRVYVRIDNSINNVIMSDIPSIDEDIIADNKIIKDKVNKNIDLNNIELNIKINNEYKLENLVSVDDIVEIEVNNINENYELYYSLKSDKLNTEYKKFDNNFLNNVTTPNKFNLYIKLVTKEYSKEINVGEFNVYDIVYEHNINTVEENKEIGTVYDEDGTIHLNEDGSEYLYDDIEVNKNIVINNNENETETLEEIEEDIKTEEEKENINLKGNIYIVEETDLNDFDIMGYIYIETEENVNIENDIFNDSNIYSITIKNNNFTINNENYYYDSIENEIKISNSNNEEVAITDIINNSKAEINDENELVIIKDEIMI